MRARSLAVFLLPVGSLACIPPLEPIAARSLSCPEAKITIEDGDATGCGRTDAFYYDFHKETYSSLRERVAFEFDCDRDSLEMTRFDSKTYGVAGCGRRGVFKYHPSTGFMLDSVGEPKDASQDKASPTDD